MARDPLIRENPIQRLSSPQSAGIRAIYWAVPAEKLLADLRSDAGGLSSSEAATRLQTAGPNAIGRERDTSAVAAFARQFRSPLVLILIFAAAVSVFVEGTRAYVEGDAFPPLPVEHRELFLRPRRKLSFEPEAMGPEHAAPDGFFQAPLTVTDRVEILSWSTAPFEEPVTLMGTGAFHLFAAIDQDDTNWIMRLWDVAASGTRQLLTTAYLKASMRELDEAASTPGGPVHPLTRKVPVTPGAIEEYVLRVYPFAATILPGHRIVVELSCDEPMVDDHNALLPPDAFHVPVGRPVTHTVYRDAQHPSRLVLPFAME